MRNKVGLKALAILFAIVMVASSVAIYSSADMRKGIDESGEKGVISLVVPSFISTARAAGGGGGAFPEYEAGISAYINTSQTIDLEKLKTIFSEVEEVGDNYIIGITPISDWGGDIDVHVYADIDGWIVAYLKSDEPAAKIMQWTGNDANNPAIGVITTILADALYEAGDAAGVGITPTKIKYYDFRYPNANSMMIFVRTRASDGTNLVQLEIPANYTLYETSYYHYAYDLDDSKLKVDGATVSDLPGCYRCWRRAFGSYGSRITTGKLHKIEISYDAYGSVGGSAGVATVLIYRAP